MCLKYHHRNFFAKALYKSVAFTIVKLPSPVEPGDLNLESRISVKPTSDQKWGPMVGCSDVIMPVNTSRDTAPLRLNSFTNKREYLVLRAIFTRNG
jgi:hypothetical protein